MPKRLRKVEKIELLSRLPLFESCTKRELGDIASLVVQASRPAGSVLTREGQDGGVMFVIAEGTAEVVSNLSGSGRRKVLGRLWPGDVVGELSLIDGQARSASVVATSDVVLLELAADDFARLLHRSPKFVKALLRALSIRVRDTEKLTV